MHFLLTACFRRVLAGKRVASHWVRRTFICERLEECQLQCSEERRFSCEGFNYRIDPSGRGQGECELTEVPLSQMDLYSSPHNRDANLIPHHDYDYYERDRTTSNCRSNCIDCGANPNYGSSNNRPPPPSSGYKPSFEPDRYGRPEVTAIDKYRPQNNFYESRPSVDSWDRFGSSNYFSASSGSNNFRPQSYPDTRPPPYGLMGSIDRYGVEENSPSYRPSSSSGGYIDSNAFNYRPQPLPPLQKPDYDRPSKPSYELPPLLPVRPISNENGYNRPPPIQLPIPSKPDFDRPDPNRPDPPYQTGLKPDSPPQQQSYGSNSPSHHNEAPLPRPGLGSGNYHEREPRPPYHPTNFHQKPSAGFVPYLIGRDNSYGSASYRPQGDYWGLKNEIKRVDGPNHFNYFELGMPHEENTIYSRYGSSHSPPPPPPPPPSHSQNSYDSMNWGTMWTRRPGMEGKNARF